MTLTPTVLTRRLFHGVPLPEENPYATPAGHRLSYYEAPAPDAGPMDLPAWRGAPFEDGSPEREAWTRDYNENHRLREAWDRAHNRGYRGLVLTTRERNYHDDSDFYAVVWTGRGVRSVDDGTTRFAAPPCMRADATDAVREKAAMHAYWAAYARLSRTVRDEAVDWAQALRKGDRVVVGGRSRKVPRGTRGEVFWLGEGRAFGYYDSPPWRAGVRGDDGKTYWLDAKHLRHESDRQWRERVPTAAACDAKARDYASRARAYPTGMSVIGYSPQPLQCWDWHGLREYAA